MYINHIIRLFPFFSPDDGGVGVSDDIETLSDNEPITEDEPEPEEKTDDTDDIEDHSPQEEDEEEEEDTKDREDTEPDEDEEEDEKLLTSWTDIKKKYPEFAKDFPDVKAALFRDQRYSEIFGSPSDAEVASGKAETLDRMSADLIDNGDPVNLLDTIVKSNKENAQKMALGVLSYFQEKDKDFYYSLAAVPIKQMLRAAYKEGRGKGENGRDSDLAIAAKHIHNFYFEDLDFDKSVKGERKVEEKSETEKRLEDKLRQINDRESKEFGKAIDDSYINRMTKHIREPLDKDERLTEYMKNKLVEDILRDVKKQMFADTRHTNRLSSLFKQARAAGFTNDFKTRLINTALVRAKSLVPEVRKKLVGEALRGKVTKKTTTERRERPERSERIERTERSSSRSSSSSSTKQPLTDLDILRSK